MKDDILKFINKFKKKHGYAPRLSEIAEGLDVHRQSVSYHVKRMGDVLKEHTEYKRYFLLTKAK